jgi:cholesterol oxidase
MDAAAFPGPVGANPSATIAAIAEYKVARFLEGPQGNHPRADHLRRLRARATAWVEEQGRARLDPLGGPAGARQSAAPAHPPVGLEFEETMVGSASLRGASYAIETSLHAQIEDLAEFLGRHERDSTVPVPIVGGTLKLGASEFEIDRRQSVMRVMTDRGPHVSGREVRRIEYDLVTRGGYRLRGEKTIRDDEGPDVWEDTTTLPFELLESDTKVGGGELRLPASEFFGRQVRSFRVNTDDPARQAWALLSFGRFFLGNLVDVYLPALDRLGELSTSLLSRGHA